MVNRMNRSPKMNMYNGINARDYSCNDCNEERSNRNPSYDKNAKMLISKLQAVDFSLIESVLYLDVYPHCQKAMARYRELLCEREKLVKMLGEAGAPISNMSNTSDNWNWTDAPWPWEYEANT